MKYQGGIKNFKQVKAKLDNMKKAPQAVLDRTLSDARTRVPGWVAKEVVKEYNIPKNEIGGKGVSKLSIKGKKLPDVTFDYTGELLTAKHFSMKPATTPVGRSYTLTAKIHKGQKSVISKVKPLTKRQRKAIVPGVRKSESSPIMLMRGNGNIYIPFQRVSTNRKDIIPKYSTSVPSMIDYETVHEAVQKDINEGLEKRLNHHMKRLLK